MKKSFFVLTAFALCAASMITFSACNKEGVYKPKQKISKIYYEEIEADKVTVEKKLKETWVWEKKKLSKIEIADGNKTINFSYDGNQISKVESDNQVMNFSYKKKKLDKIEISKNGASYQTITVLSRDGDKVTKLSCETQPNAKKMNDVEYCLMQMYPVFNLLFPNAVAISLTSNIDESKMHKSGTNTVVFEYTYEGNNITKVKTNNETSEIITRYFYDDKINPYYKSLYYMQNQSLVALSENNIRLYYDEDKKMDQKIYEFKYEEDLPISITLVEDIHGATVSKRYKINHIEYVE